MRILFFDILFIIYFFERRKGERDGESGNIFLFVCWELGHLFLTARDELGPES